MANWHPHSRNVMSFNVICYFTRMGQKGCYYSVDINIPSGPPSVPTLSCADLSEDDSGAVNVIVSWTLSGGESADFYLINITTNAPQTLYGGLLNITTASVTQHKLTGFMTNYEYNITLYGVNCGTLVGREGEPLIIRPQGK